MEIHCDIFGHESTKSANGFKSSLSMEDIIKAIDLIQKDPIKDFMISKGCNPDEGWKILIPSPLMQNTSFPEYIVPTKFISDPLMINPAVFGFYPNRFEHPKLI